MKEGHWNRFLVVAGARFDSYLFIVGAAIFVGLTLLVSGTGKLPGQTEFVDALLKSFWTPTVAYFIGYCLPLAFGFMAINSWVLINGVERFPECATCFGIWEEFLGALVLDVVLFCLALIVLLLHKEDFLTFQPWFIRRKVKRVC